MFGCGAGGCRKHQYSSMLFVCDSRTSSAQRRRATRHRVLGMTAGRKEQVAVAFQPSALTSRDRVRQSSLSDSQVQVAKSIFPRLDAGV